MRTTTIRASFFSIVLGLSGLGDGWRMASQIWQVPRWIGETILLLAGLIWLALLVLYLDKWARQRDEAIAELHHPIGSCFVSLIFASTLLAAVSLNPYSRSAALALASLGWSGHVLFTVWRSAHLWRGARGTSNTTPVLYLPSVTGNFIAAIAAAALGYSSLGTLFFGAGIFSWITIESALLHRLYTADPLPHLLRPTLGIRLSPPAVGCVAYLSVNGGVPDIFAQSMFGYALLHAAILLQMMIWIARQPFVPGYWGFSFGVTALGLSAMSLNQYGLEGPVTILAMPLFIGENLIIGYLLVRTLGLLMTGRLFLSPSDDPTSVERATDRGCTTEGEHTA